MTIMSTYIHRDLQYVFSSDCLHLLDIYAITYIYILFQNHESHHLRLSYLDCMSARTPFLGGTLFLGQHADVRFTRGTHTAKLKTSPCGSLLSIFPMMELSHDLQRQTNQNTLPDHVPYNSISRRKREKKWWTCVNMKLICMCCISSRSILVL